LKTWQTGDHQSPGTKMTLSQFSAVLRKWDSATLLGTEGCIEANFSVSGLPMHAGITINTQKDQNFTVKMQHSGCHQSSQRTKQFLQFSTVLRKWDSATLLGAEGGVEATFIGHGLPRPVKMQQPGCCQSSKGTLQLLQFSTVLRKWDSATLLGTEGGAVRLPSPFLAFQVMLESQSTPK